MRHTHSDRLERWLGTDTVNQLTAAMRDFYWPIALQNGSGRIYAMPGGDFTGEIKGGQFASIHDRARTHELRLRNELRARVARHAMWQDGRMRSALDRRRHAFSTLQDIQDAAAKGKRQDLIFVKGMPSSANGTCNDSWSTTGGSPIPVTGVVAAAAPGGTVTTNASVGALPFQNPSSANTAHYAGGIVYNDNTTTAGVILMYDKLFGVLKTINSTTAEAVTGVPTRYTSTTPTAIDYVGGNFMYPRCETILPGTAHNWTVCQYTDQGGNATQNAPSVVGVSGCNKSQIDLLAGTWFMPLAAGDVGVKAISQMQCDALVATGSIEFQIAHPIAFLPSYIVNIVSELDGINPMSLAPILDGACLSFIEVSNLGTAGTTYRGQITIVSE